MSSGLGEELLYLYQIIQLADGKIEQLR